MLLKEATLVNSLRKMINHVKLLLLYRNKNNRFSHTLYRVMIERIQTDLKMGRVRSNVHAKTRQYMTNHHLTFDYVTKWSIDHLSEAEYVRGPSEHHWMRGFLVYEFLIKIEKWDLYLKFDVSETGTLIESFHEREKTITDTWYHYRFK